MVRDFGTNRDSEKQVCSVDPILLGYFPVVTMPTGKGAAASDAQDMSSLSPTLRFLVLIENSGLPNAVEKHKPF